MTWKWLNWLPKIIFTVTVINHHDCNTFQVKWDRFIFSASISSKFFLPPLLKRDKLSLKETLAGEWGSHSGLCKTKCGVTASTGTFSKADFFKRALQSQLVPLNCSSPPHLLPVTTMEMWHANPSWNLLLRHSLSCWITMAFQWILRARKTEQGREITNRRVLASLF